MQRCLEPELMNNPAQVDAFISGSREYGIAGFLYLYKKYANITTGKIVDLGSGTGQYIDALKKEYNSLDITGYDGSEEMVKRSTSVKLCNIYNVVDTADCVISTNTLHHIHDTNKFWNVVQSIAPYVFVMDLVRPDTTQQAQEIVDTFARHDSKLFRQDFYNSLCAAFSLEELQQQVAHLNLNIAIEGDSRSLQVAVIYGAL